MYHGCLDFIVPRFAADCGSNHILCVIVIELYIIVLFYFWDICGISAY